MHFFILQTFQLIEDVMALLDNLAVWDVESDGGWKEMAHLGLSLLIMYGTLQDVEVCLLLLRGGEVETVDSRK